MEKMIGVGLVWGITNALMRRGAHIAETRGSSSSSSSAVKKWVDLVLTWQYSLPFAVNLSASAAFFYVLGEAPISLAVPVTNATTFAATALAAMLLGEETRVGFALFGTVLIVLGVWICLA